MTSARLRLLAVVFATAILGGFCGFGVQLINPPPFASKMSFYVSTPSLTGVEVTNSPQLIALRGQSYATIIAGESVREGVLSGLGLSSKSNLSLTATFQSGTALISVESDSTNASLSLRALQYLQTYFPKEARQLDEGPSSSTEGPVRLVVADSPIGPTAGNTVALDTAIGFLGAGLLAAALLYGVRQRRAELQRGAIPELQ